MGHNSLTEALMTKDWDGAEFHSKKGRVYTLRAVKVDDFFDGNIASEVYPLHIAAQQGAPLKVIHSLLEGNPDAAMAPDSKYKRLPLHLAVMQGAAPKVVLALLKNCPQAAKAQDRLGRLPLHYACKSSANSEVNTRYLLKAYAKAATKADLQGYTALHVSCRCGSSLAIIRMLIRVAPGVVYAKTGKGSTPMTCAKQAGDDPLVIDILQRGEADSLKANSDDIFELGSLAGSISTFHSSPTMGDETVLSKGGGESSVNSGSMAWLEK